VILSACGILKPYESELGQGNFIRAEQVAQLEIGQTPEQVVFILGTPLLTGEEPTHRWTYPTFETETGYSNLVINFADGVVVNFSKQ